MDKIRSIEYNAIQRDIDSAITKLKEKSLSKEERKWLISAVIDLLAHLLRPA